MTSSISLSLTKWRNNWPKPLCLIFFILLIYLKDHNWTQFQIRRHNGRGRSKSTIGLNQNHEDPRRLHKIVNWSTSERASRRRGVFACSVSRLKKNYGIRAHLIRSDQETQKKTGPVFYVNTTTYWRVAPMYHLTRKTDWFGWHAYTTITYHCYTTTRSIYRTGHWPECEEDSKKCMQT